jgi:hypothetical protein
MNGPLCRHRDTPGGRVVNSPLEGDIPHVREKIAAANDQDMFRCPVDDFIEHYMRPEADHPNFGVANKAHVDLAIKALKKAKLLLPLSKLKGGDPSDHPRRQFDADPACDQRDLP